jgi:hypothetical protein
MNGVVFFFLFLFFFFGPLLAIFWPSWMQQHMQAEEERSMVQKEKSAVEAQAQQLSQDLNESQKRGSQLQVSSTSTSLVCIVALHAWLPDHCGFQRPLNDYSLCMSNE